MQKTKLKRSRESSTLSAKPISTPLRAKKPLREQKSWSAQEDMMRVRQALSGLVETAEVDRWLAAPNVVLGGVRPADAVQEGRAAQVLEVLARVQEGLYM